MAIPYGNCPVGTVEGVRGVSAPMPLADTLYCEISLLLVFAT